MYTFYPLLDTSMNHTGFYIVAVVCAVFAGAILLDMFTDGLTGSHLTVALILAFAVYVSYNVSYNDRPPINTPVSAKLVGFQPEGYNEQSGKMRADRHYMYVVYEIDGHRIIMQAREGATYPEQATLYKN